MPRIFLSYRWKHCFFLLFFILMSLGIVEISLKTFFSDLIAPARVFKLITKDQQRFSHGRYDEYLRWDKDLIYKYRPHVSHLEVNFQAALIQDDFYIDTNADGYRYPPESVWNDLARATGRKIICLGESWTMGWGVNADMSYPEQLRRMIVQQLPEKYEIFNFGAITYTSFQGIAILKKVLPYLKSGDIVIIGYNANDPRHGFTLHDVYNGGMFLQEKIFHDIVFHLAEGFTTWKIVRTILQQIQRKISPRQSDYFWEYIPRVPADVYLRNYKEMIRMTRSKKATPVILYHGLMREEDYTVKMLYRISQQTKTPLVNVHTPCVQRIQQKIQKDESRYPDLKPSEIVKGPFVTATPITIRFRVAETDELYRHVPPRKIARLEIVYLDWTPQAGYIERTSVLNDSGTDGDEHPGDGIWSTDLVFAPDLRFLKVSPLYNKGRFTGSDALYFFFYFRTIDRKGKIYPEMYFEKVVPLYVGLWRELCIGKVNDIPNDMIPYKEIAAHRIDYAEKTVAPLYFFGRRRLRSEFLHPTAEGYHIFADELFKVLKQTVSRNQE